VGFLKNKELKNIFYDTLKLEALRYFERLSTTSSYIPKHFVLMTFCFAAIRAVVVGCLKRPSELPQPSGIVFIYSAIFSRCA
jgi:hypothetical protein